MYVYVALCVQSSFMSSALSTCSDRCQFTQVGAGFLALWTERSCIAKRRPQGKEQSAPKATSICTAQRFQKSCMSSIQTLRKRQGRTRQLSWWHFVGWAVSALDTALAKLLAYQILPGAQTVGRLRADAVVLASMLCRHHVVVVIQCMFNSILHNQRQFRN